MIILLKVSGRRKFVSWENNYSWKSFSLQGSSSDYYLGYKFSSKVFIRSSFKTRESKQISKRDEYKNLLFVFNSRQAAVARATNYFFVVVFLQKIFVLCTLSIRSDIIVSQTINFLGGEFDSRKFLWGDLSPQKDLTINSSSWKLLKSLLYYHEKIDDQESPIIKRNLKYFLARNSSE